MALKIEFEGWVNEIKQFDWGQVVRMTHQIRSKNAQTGEWETTGKDYIDVSVSHDSGIIVPDAKLLRVNGTFKVDTYTKNDGTVAVAVKVRASSLEAVERDTAPAVSGFSRAVVDEDMPF